MTTADKLAQVLAEHTFTHYDRATGQYTCTSCGAPFGSRGGMIDFAAHQAAVVLAHLTAEGWAQGGAVVHVHHHDIEHHAASFNEGYEAAMTQHLADDPSLAEDWLNTKLADAWDKGFIHCNRPFGLQCPPTDNPYRTEAHHA